ncbi:hypothetical protein [Methylomonas koyamae]|uniref:hypothetical protein n=1 Tax=Methylomonas koyamae TaxID=702114 RepID=UPI0006D07165|nr:hypothetical protein [Methylomonas koyamae]
MRLEFLDKVLQHLAHFFGDLVQVVADGAGNGNLGFVLAQSFEQRLDPSLQLADVVQLRGGGLLPTNAIARSG